jgi:hypothetical protein
MSSSSSLPPPLILMLNKETTDSVVLVRKRSLPSERPPLVGEVSVNLSDG